MKFHALADRPSHVSNRGEVYLFGPGSFNGKLAPEAILEMGKNFKTLKNLVFYFGVLLKFFPGPVVPKLQLGGAGPPIFDRMPG